MISVSSACAAIERFPADVGVGTAVQPVEVVSARTPAAPVVLRDA